MYTVKQAAALTGVPQASLRAWERRYGIVRPSRSDGGYRLYDDAQIALLRTMARLIAEGVPASVAAARVRETAPWSALAVASSPAGDLVTAARTLDPQHIRRLIDGALAAGPFEEVLGNWLLPQTRQLGDAWAAGELTIAQEHFASGHLMRAISVIFEADEYLDSSPPVLVGLPPGSQHEIGLLCFATCLRRIGVQVIYLGSNVPVAEWVSAASGLVARGAVLAATMHEDIGATQAVVDACHDVSPPLAVWVGGRSRDGVRGANLLPDDMAEAARSVRLSLAAGVA